jgi:hypothetical protein
MKSISFFAKLFKTDGKPAVSVRCSLQTYNLQKQRWETLKSINTNSRGNIGTTANFVSPGNNPPLMRLVSGNSGTNVLASSGVLTYDKNIQRVSIDFGEVEVLAGEAFRLKSSHSKFSNLRLNVAGQERKAPVVGATTRMFVASSTVRPTVATARMASATAAPKPDPQLAVLKSSEVKLKKQVSDKDTALKKSNTDLSALRVTHSTLNNEAVFLRRENVRLKGQVAAKPTKNTPEGDAELRELREKKLVSERRIIALDNEKKDLEKRLEDSAKKTGKPTPIALQHKPIASVMTNFGGEMHDANQVMKTRRMPFKLSHVKVKVKGVMDDSGSIAFNDPDKTAAAGSEVEFTLTDNEENDEVHNVRVPDITNLTESLARRMLGAVGLRMETASQTFDANAEVAHGECVNQSPEMDVEVPVGDTVFAVFAVKKEA